MTAYPPQATCLLLPLFIVYMMTVSQERKKEKEPQIFLKLTRLTYILTHFPIKPNFV